MAKPVLNSSKYFEFNNFFSSCLLDKNPISINTDGKLYDFKTEKPANL